MASLLILRLIAGSSGTQRSTRLRRIAAASTMAGSLFTRQGWVQAGLSSAENPSGPLELPPQRTLAHRT